MDVEWSWDCFLYYLRRDHPAIAAEAPETGCVDEVEEILAVHGLRVWFRSALLAASGDRAWLLYLAARRGLISRSGLRAAILAAPGDRAWALYYAARDGLIPREGLRAAILASPGERVWALHFAKRRGLIPFQD